MIVSDHIKTYLGGITEKIDPGFEEIYLLIENPKKPQTRKLLIYTDKLLNEILCREDTSLKYSHFHFEGVDQDTIDILAEFTVIKLFFYGLQNDVKGGTFIKNKINSLNNDSIYDSKGLSGKSTKFKKLIEKQKKLKRRKIFYESLLNKNSKASLLPNTLMNVLQRGNAHFEKVFETIPFVIPIENLGKESSYVLLNTEYTRDTIDKIEIENDQFLMDTIENIVVFDCEQKQLHRGFSYTELNKWNTDFGSLFKNLFVFSFSEGDFSFYRLMTRIERIQSRFYTQPRFPEYATYSVLPEEIDILLGKKEKAKSELQFIGDSTCSFWKTFKDNIGFYEGLYELRSLKMMNVYSLVLNEKLKDYVLSDIFSISESSNLLLEETKNSLLELSDESILELRTNLANTLDMIIGSNISESIKASVNERTTIILPEPVYKNENWKKEITATLSLRKDCSLASWSKVDQKTFDNVIVLDYRDLGKFPYRITPNIFENSFINSKKIKGVFLSFFFRNKWEWTRFNHTRDMIKLLGHSAREKHFAWSNFSKKNQQIELEKEEAFDWDFETALQRDYEPESVKIRYKNPVRSRTYHPSDPFILQNGESENLRVMRLSEIESPNPESILKVQHLDELYSEFNLYEKLANVEREKKEIQVIRDKYGLNRNEEAGRLWKILLKRKADEKGIEVLYEEMKGFLASKGVGFVSLNTFEKRWMNPESDSLITRGKKIFLYLCEFLGLEKSYVGIMLRIKNAEVQASRSSNKQMNNLLGDLINDGCFNNGVDLNKVLPPLKERYIQRHDFDQIAVEENKVVSTLITLVELLKPEIALEQVDKIDKL